MSKHTDKCMELLFEIEKDPAIIEGFNHGSTNSWVTVKNFIYERSLTHLEIEKQSIRISEIFFLLIIITTSLINYIRSLKKDNIPIFIGAGSGLIKQQKKVVDTYMSSSLKSHLYNQKFLYLTSADKPAKLIKLLPFIIKKKVIVYSYIVAPLRLLLKKKIYKNESLNNPKLAFSANEIARRFHAANIDIKYNDIIQLHARFIAGYRIFSALLKPFSFSGCHVVSAYSNAEICAVLKLKGTHITEVQHGIIGPTHRGYNYHHTIKNIPTPDVIEVYDNFWKNQLLKADYFRENQIKIQPRYKYETAKKISNITNKSIIITGQSLRRDDVLKLIQDILDSDSKIQIIYAPHPNESKEYIASFLALEQKYPQLILTSHFDHSTESWIMSCSAHVSIYSSCHFDSVHYHGKTYVYDVIPNNVMYYYCENQPDSFVKFTNAINLLKMINKNDE
jgi:hypothetical protein